MRRARRRDIRCPRPSPAPSEIDGLRTLHADHRTNIESAARPLVLIGTTTWRRGDIITRSLGPKGTPPGLITTSHAHRRTPRSSANRSLRVLRPAPPTVARRGTDPRRAGTRIGGLKSDLGCTIPGARQGKLFALVSAPQNGESISMGSYVNLVIRSPCGRPTTSFPSAAGASGTSPAVVVSLKQLLDELEQDVIFGSPRTSLAYLCGHP